MIYLLRALGAMLVPVGIVGLFVPLLQGVLLLILGIYLLTLGYPNAHTRIRKYLRTTPFFLKTFDSLDRRVRGWLKLPD